MYQVIKLPIMFAIMAATNTITTNCRVTAPSIVKRSLWDMNCESTVAKWVLKECVYDALNEFSNEQQSLLLDVNSTFNQVLSELSIEQKMHTITADLFRLLLFRTNVKADPLLLKYEKAMNKYSSALENTKNFTTVFKKLHDEMKEQAQNLYIPLKSNVYSLLYVSAFLMSLGDLCLIIILYCRLCKIGAARDDGPIVLTQRRPLTQISYNE